MTAHATRQSGQGVVTIRHEFWRDDKGQPSRLYYSVDDHVSDEDLPTFLVCKFKSGRFDDRAITPLIAKAMTEQRELTDEEVDAIVDPLVLEKVLRAA